MITFNNLATYLPTGAIEFVGNNQVKINFNLLTGQAINLDSSALKGLAILLDSLASMTDAINHQRASATPPIAPITFVSKTLGGTVTNPQMDFAVTLNSSHDFVNNLVDPTN